MNNAMIYYHFQDKTELFKAVLSDSFTAFDRIWENPIFHSKSSSRQKIQKYVEEMIRFQHANEELRRILSMEFASCGQNVKWLADNVFHHGYQNLVRILKDGMKNGELKNVDPAMAIATLVGMVIHSFIMKPLAEYVTGKKMNLPVKQFGEFVTEMFFEGLALKLDLAEMTGRKVRI